ncbi:MFS transporter [Actinoplanes sp. NPDC051494]|uniref:MFS transporter n=1 Tax=Actinoplanes sp. NPDC051494 TaxID=3363907 RepID=UPI00378BB7F9
MTAVSAPPRGLAPVLQAGIAQAALGYAITGLGACLVLLAGDLKVAPEDLAWLPATFGFGLLLIAPAGPYVLRHGPRLGMVAGALALAAGMSLLALSPTLPLIGAGALFIGMGGAAIVLVTPVVMAGAAAQLTKVIGVSSAASVLAPAAIGGLDASGIGNGRIALLMGVPPLLLLAVATRPAAPVVPGGSTARPAVGVTARRWTVVLLAVAVEFCFTIWAVARLTGTGLPASRAALLSIAFPIGMAIGRLTGPLLIDRIPIVTTGAVVTAAGAVTVIVAGGPGPVTAGLVVAGLGVATLYPMTLAGLVATPGLSAAHAASLGALASGTAIVAAPAALARLGDVVELRLAYLITLPLLALLLLLRHRR